MDEYICTMKKFYSYGSSVIIVVIAMVIILPLLAYLQYTWLGQISEQEYERMKDNLQTTAFHCSMDFSREITDLMKSIGKPLAGSNNNMQKIMHERISKWKMTSKYPALVSAETQIVSLSPHEQTFLVAGNEGRTFLLFKNLSAIAIPIEHRPRQVVLVSLNREYISSTILPKIIWTNFSSRARSEYDIVIIDERGTPLYSSFDIGKNTVFQKSDLIIPLLIFPPVPRSPMFSGRPIHTQRRADREKPPVPFERDFRGPEPRQDFSPPGETLPPREREGRSREQGLFEIHIKYHEGSLEAAVNNNRLRNLGISFGVLVLLGASMVFLLLSTMRARLLAQQQLEFVAGISHELRTPLAVLKSAGENLADGVIQEKDRTRKYGELIKNEVIRLSEMVEKALTYAGIQSGKQRYELHRLDIAPIITEAIRNVKKILPLYDFKVDTDIDLNLPQVLGDATALQSALENLIINGIKYSLEKKWIKIVARYTKNLNSSFVKIEVEDCGVGISAEDISNIFKPFYRGRNAVEGQIQGSGLGLNITKHIIESLGGSISVKSSLKSGSTFTILLPSITPERETT